MLFRFGGCFGCFHIYVSGMGEVGDGEGAGNDGFVPAGFLVGFLFQ